MVIQGHSRSRVLESVIIDSAQTMRIPKIAGFARHRLVLNRFEPALNFIIINPYFRVTVSAAHCLVVLPLL